MRGPAGAGWRAWALGAALAGLVSLPAAAAEATLSGLPNVELDQIEVTGVASFTQSEIENLLEIAPGDRLERVKVIRTAENLEEFYRSHGYERAGVRTSLRRAKGDNGQLQYVLDYVVTEGKPTRVSEMRFTSDSAPSESFRKYWRSLEPELAAKAALVPGDVYDQDRVSTARRAIQDLLASEEFIGARISDVRVSEGTAPLVVPAPKLKDAGRWVALDFHIDLGDRVAFGFRGNTVFTHGKLSSLVDEQRVVGFGKDYVGAIRARIEEEYRSEGYAEVKVTPYTSENPTRQERRVTYDITEGPRVGLDGVAFDGNTVFSGDELRSRFFSNASVLIQHGYYVEKDVQKALDLVVEWMKSNGYLSAKVLTITNLPAIKPKRAGQKLSALRLVVYIYEGDQTLVQSVNIDGVAAFTREDVKAKLGLKEGKPLNLFAFNEGLEALKAAYRDKGYLDVRISNEGTDRVVRYTDDNRQADVQVQVVEGRQFKVGDIEIDGLVSTKEYVVRRELTFHEGDLLRESDLNETQARLRKLGIFSTVSVHVRDDPAKPDIKRVLISLQEGTPGVLAGGPGFRSDLGFRAFGEVAYTNLWGLNHTLSFTTDVNHRIDEFHFVEYDAQLAYIYPWFMNTDITFRPSITVNGTQYIGFDADVLDMSLTWEKRLVRDPNFTVFFTYSLERIIQFDAANVVDDQQLRIGSITPGFRIDTRDNALSPTRGWFATATWEIAAPWMFSQNDPYPIGYSRIQARVDHIIPLVGGVSWYLSARAGYEISTEPQVQGPNGLIITDSGTIPLIKQFALGGVASLRGYNEQELNAYNEFINGSLSYVNYRTQMDFPIAGSLRVGPFLDAANLLIDNHSIGQFFFDSVEFGAGLGLHYQTPVGPVNLDVGYRLSPPYRTDSPLQGQTTQPSQFYFSIGLI